MTKENHVLKTARFNRNRPEEHTALEIIAYWEDHGVNFKQLIVDRLLRAENIDPVMFVKGDYPVKRPVTIDELREALSEMPKPESITLEDVRQMLERFADDLVRQLKRRADVPRIDNDEDEDTDSAFARNFARGFMQRQRRASGEEDE